MHVTQPLAGRDRYYISQVGEDTLGPVKSKRVDGLSQAWMKGGGLLRVFLCHGVIGSEHVMCGLGAGRVQSQNAEMSRGTRRFVKYFRQSRRHIVTRLRL